MPAHSIAGILINLIISMYWLVSLALLFAAFDRYWPSIAGWLGEAAVKKSLARLSAKGFHVIHDILLPCSDGETTQIDHVVIGKSSVYVIETKNIGGAIYGQGEDPNWTVVYNRYRKHIIQNPFRQNHRHIEAIHRVAGNNIPVQNLVVVVRDTFPKGEPKHVLSPAGLVRYIRSAEECGREGAFDASQIAGAIYDNMIIGSLARKLHVRRIHERFGGRSSMPAGHALVALAAIVFIAGFVHSETMKTPKVLAGLTPRLQGHAGTWRGSAVPASSSLLQRGLTFPYSSSHITQPNNLAIPKQPNVIPIDILGSGNGVATVREKGNFCTLHNGEVTPAWMEACYRYSQSRRYDSAGWQTFSQGLVTIKLWLPKYSLLRLNLDVTFLYELDQAY